MTLPWRLLWTLSVRLTGPSRLTVWIEDRYVAALRRAGRRAIVMVSRYGWPKVREWRDEW